MIHMKFLPTLAPSQMAVCLHASASTSRQWQPLGEALETEGYDLITPDLYGYGQGPNPNANFSMADEVDHVLSTLNEWTPFHLIGHSYGGVVALRIAQHVPERILSLTLFEPVAFGYLKESDPVAFAEAERVLGSIAHLVDDGECVQAATRFINYWAGDHAFEHMPDYLPKNHCGLCTQGAR